MPRKLASVAPLEEFDPEDPRIADKDPTMIPGHPLCNYAKWMAAQELVDVVMQGDYENRHFKTYHLSFNGFRSPEYPYNETVQMPKPFAVQALLSGRASTSNVALRRELAGQIAAPIEGPIAGPISGDLASDKF